MLRRVQGHSWAQLQLCSADFDARLTYRLGDMKTEKVRYGVLRAHECEWQLRNSQSLRTTAVYGAGTSCTSLYCDEEQLKSLNAAATSTVTFLVLRMSEWLCVSTRACSAFHGSAELRVLLLSDSLTKVFEC